MKLQSDVELSTVCQLLKSQRCSNSSNISYRIDFYEQYQII